MDIRRAGDRAVLIELPDLNAVLDVADQLRELRLQGVRDIVPASKTVLVSAWSPRALARVIEAVRAIELRASRRETRARVVDIDVVYDGEDLHDVADLLGLSTDAVIAAHTDHEWTAAFGGFAPGFAYLVADGNPLDVPRRDSPRTSVPSGSVAVAGGYSAVYPRDSPGGWQLLGRTTAPMWDSQRTPPNLVAHGDVVRFHAVREAIPVLAEGRQARSHAGAFTVLAPGMQSLIQDRGRPGNAAVGVTASGAMDRPAAQLANSLVGNPLDAAVIESLFGGLRLRAERPVVVVVTGAEVAAHIANEKFEWSVPTGTPFALEPGWEVEVGTPTAGLRSYLAVRGGFDVDTELDSRSTDVLSGLGPAPLRTGDALPIGREPHEAVKTPVSPPPCADCVELRFVPGPRADWFSAESLAKLADQSWEVTSDSNRVGLRLKGNPLERAQSGELPSEGMTRGSLQVPPNGQPVLFLADHPVTGGYPVIGTVLDADTDLAGQLAPGNQIRFVRVSGEP
ncbi:5-oxoprolinase/urea amidolyase family protein [Smaragdicoccus niigatensis]|uniref:5-oxoprolinase subunit B/C family protein n=1 Tax=Smaragdicoccus niigatensis TaxID=359359 RepID=UPI00036F853A|nr:5-oxoprolinase/urea amidolyase family protein [Smaragdicoccus niigatensis]